VHETVRKGQEAKEEGQKEKEEEIGHKPFEAGGNDCPRCRLAAIVNDARAGSIKRDRAILATPWQKG
jgi:hypothetical protein